LDDRRHHCDLRVVFVPLGTPPGGRIKALVMSDVSQRLRVQAKLKELIGRASTAAEISIATDNNRDHADCNDHGHCKGGDCHDPPLKGGDGSKDPHDHSNDHDKNSEPGSPFAHRQFVLTHLHTP
jgi:hypothetical protein